MTPEALAEALRLRLPHTEIVLGDRPGRVVVKMSPKPHNLTVYVALSKSGERCEISTEDPTQRPRDNGGWTFTADSILSSIAAIVARWTIPDNRRIYDNPNITPRIRAWVHLPDMPPIVKARARALLNADRAALAKLRKEVTLHEEDIAALERALGVAPTSTDPIRAAAEQALSTLEGACWDDGRDAYGLQEARQVLRNALEVKS